MMMLVKTSCYVVNRTIALTAECFWCRQYIDSMSYMGGGRKVMFAACSQSLSCLPWSSFVVTVQSLFLFILEGGRWSYVDA